MKLPAAALLLTLALPVMGCLEEPVFGKQPTNEVQVLGRTWSVTQIAEQPPTYRAFRNATTQDPFGPPGSLKETQAVKAIEASTACRIVPSSFYRDVADYFYAQVTCG